MTLKAQILAHFANGAAEPPLYLPDLTLWYDWHRKKDTLPPKWREFSLPQIARDMGVPVWLTTRPWRVETSGINITVTEKENERLVQTETVAGKLTAHWITGPDSAWWQTEYPVKTADDLAAALEIVNARTYTVDATSFNQLEESVGEDGIMAIEIPRRPYSDLLHEFLGWNEGLMLLNEPVVTEINNILEKKLQQLVQEIAQLPGSIIFSPDNLDGQFISPPAFDEYLAGSYRSTTEILHPYGKYLLVHVGGPIRHLLPTLADTGVDGLEGIAGLPQNNASLTQARLITGPEMTLWGGIPQDFLMADLDEQDFEAAVQQVVQEAKDDRRMIFGVADRVPVDAELNRLESLPVLIERAL